ncbi:hypothetical protein PACTADRAFT_51447, partial [Pachysolen tannophilus NRRL Y-2460]
MSKRPALADQFKKVSRPKLSQQAVSSTSGVAQPPQPPAPAAASASSASAAAAPHHHNHQSLPPKPSTTPVYRNNNNKSEKFNKKRNKLFNSRQIRLENSDPSFKEGKLDVPSFIKSRLFEINQLEQAQLRSKFSSSTRCFQSLPRTLRRRTASHNVKRVPKRMRAKALREMKLNHDTNNGNVLVKRKHLSGRELYRLKTTKKLLKIAAKLKTDKLNNFNTSISDFNLRNKIKEITSKINEIEEKKLRDNEKNLTQEEKLISRSKLFLNNSMGSYDNLGVNKLASRPRGNAKYMKRQKNNVWLPTHVMHAKRAHMIKRWGYQIPLEPTQKCYKSTHRKSILDGALIFDTSYYDCLILTCLPNLQNNLKDLILKISNNQFKGKFFNSNKVWQGLLYIQDIENEDKNESFNKIIGKGSIYYLKNEKETKALIRMHPSTYKEFFDFLLSYINKDNDDEDKIKLYDCRYSLGSIELAGPASISCLTQILHPTKDFKNLKASQYLTKLSTIQDLDSISVGTIFAFDVDDPRLWDKPYKNPRKPRENEVLDLIIDINQGSSINHDTLQKLFTFEGRLKSYENQPSTKMLSSRRSQNPPSMPLPKLSSDPTIPLMIVKTSAIRYSIILPWYWVLPFWYNFNKIPHLQMGGLKQLHQLNFESEFLNFPNDYPFLRQGYVENFLNGIEMHRKWLSKQTGKKINFEKLDLNNDDEEFGKGEIGFPFNSDWRFLQILRHALKLYEKSINEKGDQKANFETTNWAPNHKRILKNLSDVYEYIEDIKALDKEKLARGELLLQNPVELATDLTKIKQEFFNSTISFSNISTLKIIPIKVKILRKGHPTDNARIYSIPKTDYNKWIQSLNHLNIDSKKTSKNIPPCPPANHLIGFLTSATFNLCKGCGSGIGYIDAQFALNKTKKN